jgi:peptidoglycan/xylan/chitin deacetylase (PgdA/CDA1 family)
MPGKRSAPTYHALIPRVPSSRLAAAGQIDIEQRRFWIRQHKLLTVSSNDRTVTRRQIIGFSVAGVILATGAALWSAPEWLIDGVATLFPGCLYRVPTRAPLVALTIDDGPDPASTPLILAELRRHRARATFFLIADRVPSLEHIVRRLTLEGHELGNHFTRDHPSIRLSPTAFEADLLRAHQVLAPFGPVKWARPGSGWYSRAMIRTMRRHGYRCALGSVYPFDATIPSAAFAAHYILRHARPGAVVILHDGGGRGQRTAKVLAEVLPELRRRGYQVVSLSELDEARQLDSAIPSRFSPSKGIHASTR